MRAHEAKTHAEPTSVSSPAKAPAAVNPVGAPPNVLKVVEYDNPDFQAPKYPFTYEDPREPRLIELRERYKFDDVVGAGGEFERQLKLLDWNAARFKHGSYAPPELSKKVGEVRHDALRYLRAGELGASFKCPFAAIVYMQCCLAMGWPARLVEICKAHCEWVPSTEKNVAHTVLEVWSNQYRKWILMDADSNVHYTRAGVPLSALDLHDAWVRDESAAVEMRPGATVRAWDPRGSFSQYDLDGMKRDFLRNKILDYYQYVRVTLRNNHLSDPHTPDRNLFLPQVEWVDPAVPPLLMRLGTFRPLVYYTDVRSCFEWPLNLTHIRLSAENNPTPDFKGILRVRLDTETPWFKQFEMSLDNESWQSCPATFQWRLHNGLNRLQISSVNLKAVRGNISTVSVSYG